MLILLISLFSSTVAFEKGMSVCEVGSYDEIVANAKNQTCNGDPCSSLSEGICHYIRGSCDRAYMTTVYLDFYWCAPGRNNWIVDWFPFFLIVCCLFLVKVLWSTVDEFLDYSLYNTIAMWTSEKVACVSLLAIGSHTPVVGIGMTSLLWHESWGLWIGLNLSIALIYNAGLIGLAFVRFVVQLEERLGKLSLFFLIVLCIFFPIMVLQDQITLVTAISLLVLHAIFTVCVWFVTTNNADLNSVLLAAVRELNYHESVEFRKKKPSRKNCVSTRSQRNIFKRQTSLSPSHNQFSARNESNPFVNESWNNPLVDQSENNPSGNNPFDQSKNNPFVDKSKNKVGQPSGSEDEGCLSSSLETIFIVDDECSPLLKGICNPELACCTRLLLLFELPLTLLRFLLIPDTAAFFFWDGRQRIRATISITLGVQWLVWLYHKEGNGYGNWDWHASFEREIIMLIAGTIGMGLLFYFTTGPRTPPKKGVYLLLQIFAIAVTCTFVYELANQIVNICFFFTMSFRYVDLFWLGFSILGPIVCLPDIIDFITSATDASNEIVEIDHTSPLMNLLIGLWLPCLCRMLKCEDCIHIKDVKLIPVTCVSLAVTAIVQLIVLEFQLNIGVWRTRVGTFLLISCGICFIWSWIGNFYGAL